MTETRPEGGASDRVPGEASVGPPERAVVRRAQAGDREAFDELVRTHFTRIYSVLFRMVGNHEDAEDLAQQSFVKAWDSLGYFREVGSFAAWLYRIALHVARDHQRGRGRRPDVVSLGTLGSLGGEPAEATHRGPSQELAGRELSRWIADALQRLPHRQRAALVLRVYEGLEYDDVARAIGVRPHTARFYVMRARGSLMRWLDAWKRGGEA